MHRVIGNISGEFVFAKDSVNTVKDILNKYNFNKNFLNKVLKCVELHEEKSIDCENNLELKILQDADILDALGKVGLRRTLTYCKNKNIPIFNKNYDLNCAEYVPDIFPISTVHYVYRTMIPNAKNLHTKTGKILGKNLIKKLEKFVKNYVK